MSGLPEASVEAAVERFLLGFAHPARLLVAVSGGSDSTGLLLALHAVLASGRFPHISLSACTVDHGLRAGSDREALAVAASCARLGIPHVIRCWDDTKPATGLQAAARAARYGLLKETAVAQGADAILTGHTADDQRETIAMRASRGGAGVGLSGMAEAVLVDRAVWVLRPLISVDRHAIRTYLLGAGETWMDDPSNANRVFERVRIRQSMAAGMAAGVELPAGDGAGDRRVQAETGARFLTRHVAVVESAVGRLREEGIREALAEAAAWRALLLLAATVGGRTFPVDRERADRLHTFLASGKLSRATAGGVVFDRRADGLYLYREARGIAETVIPGGLEVVWDGRYRISNTGPVTVTIRPGRSTMPDAFGTLPTGVAQRALKAMPTVVAASGAETAANHAVVPVVAPYDRFLPRFDLALADALADGFGLPRFSRPPNE
jgi:tRNA(Ile)-lysidine synthase